MKKRIKKYEDILCCFCGGPIDPKRICQIIQHNGIIGIKASYAHSECYKDEMLKKVNSEQ